MSQEDNSQAKPKRPKKVRSKQPKTPPSLKLEGDDIAKPTSLDTNKYAPKNRIGSNLSGKKVTKVGLGGLSTVTSYGN